MKRTSFRKRVAAFPAPFVRPIVDRETNFDQPSSGSGQRHRRTRKIFIIKQLRRLPAANETDRNIQRVLMFDNHPDTIRLLFGSRANRHVDLAASERVSFWDLTLVSVLIMSALIGMFWPLL
jgi:hypothetical protein